MLSAYSGVVQMFNTAARATMAEVQKFNLPLIMRSGGD
jgi:hypothetical protein